MLIKNIALLRDKYVTTFVQFLSLHIFLVFIELQNNLNDVIWSPHGEYSYLRTSSEQYAKAVFLENVGYQKQKNSNVFIWRVLLF